MRRNRHAGQRLPPADAQTLYQIASCTKAFTATAAAVLATEGKLDFDTPVIEYLPAFRLNDRYATENLTLRDFLSHRSACPGTSTPGTARAFRASSS